MRLERPILLNGRVTEVLHLPQHSCHEGGAQLLRISAHPLPLLISDILSYPSVIVKGRQGFKETTATIQVPVCTEIDL